MFILIDSLWKKRILPLNSFMAWVIVLCLAFVLIIWTSAFAQFRILLIDNSPSPNTKQVYSYRYPRENRLWSKLEYGWPYNVWNDLWVYKYLDDPLNPFDTYDPIYTNLVNNLSPKPNFLVGGYDGELSYSQFYGQNNEDDEAAALWLANTDQSDTGLLEDFGRIQNNDHLSAKNYTFSDSWAFSTTDVTEQFRLILSANGLDFDLSTPDVFILENVSFDFFAWAEQSLIYTTEIEQLWLDGYISCKLDVWIDKIYNAEDNSWGGNGGICELSANNWTSSEQLAEGLNEISIPKSALINGNNELEIYALHQRIIWVDHVTWEITSIYPVELSSFDVSAEGNKIILSWSTTSEINNFGFEVERSLDKINFKKIGFVKGNGTTAVPQKYSYIDSYVTQGSWYYRLKQIDTDGSFEHSEIVEVTNGNPKKYKLSQNYPNPFNLETKIKYQLPQHSKVILKIYDILGQNITTLINKDKPAGYFEVLWDGKDNNGNEVVSGVYFYRFETENFFTTKKIIKQK